MRKVGKYITSIVALLTIFALSSFVPIKGQTLNVFILYGTDAVSYVEVCQGAPVALTVETFGGTGTGLTYTWSGDTNPLYFNDFGDLVSYKSTTPAGTYNLTVDVEDDGGFKGSASVTVEIKPSPLANIIAMGPTTFCQGGSVELQENSGQSGVTYQWQRNFSNLSGATSFNYTASVSGNYRIRVTGTNGCSKTSNTIPVTVNSLPSATASNDGPSCYNGTINLTSGPAGMMSYAWTTNAVTPFTSTEQNPSITNVTPNNSGNYTVTVKDINGCENTAVTSVVVYDQLNGGTIGSDENICYNGDPMAFSNTTSPSGGTGAWTYSWQSKVGAGSWTPIAGANGLTYDVPAGLTQTTMYRRVATNSCGSVNSNEITVTVYADLNGGTISSSQSICYNGDPSAFSNDASASGGDGSFTYSWESKVGAGSWTTIVGATGLTYDVPLGLTQTTMYRRVAVNSCGTVYSNELTVTVYNAITGGAIASDQSVCYGGDPVAFTDATSPSGGNGAWSYQWESRVGLGAWSAIGGANAITYDIPLGITQTTSYRRVSTNACGSANSNELTITVYPQMNGGTITGDQSLCYNADPAIINTGVAPSGGNGTWIYSWEYQSNCAGGWIAIAGANGLTYDPPANQTETRCYRRVATNDCGTVYSNTVTITIYADINGGAIAADQTVCNGADPVAFTSGSIATGGNGAFTYFWQQNTGSGWTNIIGASGLTYDVPAGITQTTQYRRGATNLCGTGYSNTLTVTVSNAINGGQISSPAAVCYNGDPVAFTDISSPSGGSGAWIYSWEYRVGLGSWNVIAGENALTYDIPTGQTQTRTYRRVATNDCGTGYSNEVTVTVYANTVAGTISGDQTLCYNGDPSIITSGTLPTGGDASWTYLWEYQSNCAGGWIGIAGATSSTYDPPANQTETRCYRRVEINTCGTLYSNTVTITVIPEITGNTISSDQIICSGSSPAQLAGPIPAGGSGVYTYQWQSSTTAATGPFTNISGANNQNYSPAALTQTTYFRRVVTSGVCTSQSNAVTVTVNPSIANNTISAAQTICYNTSPSQLTGSTPTGGSGAYTYQWQSSTAGVGGPFANIAGATSINYQPSNLTQNTWFRRIVNSLPCTDNFSNVIAITVSPDFSVTSITPVSPTCNGNTNGSATVNTSGGIAPYTYSWNTTPVQTTQTATGLSAGINYTVTVTDASLCVAVGNVTLTEPAAISLGSITVNAVTGCFGNNNGSIQIVGAGGTPQYTYRLYDAGNNLIATQNPTLPAGANFAGLLGGTYSVSISDANSCPSFVQSNIVVSQPAQITITDVQTTPISCAGSSDGTITIIATGGTGALEYSINNGVTYQASNVFNVGEGYYDIVVRDASGCSATWPTVVELTEPNEISFEFSVKNVTTCYGDNTGRISIYNVSGGSGTGYEYSIYQPESWGTNPVFDNLAGGPTNLYYVKVRDSHGCIQAANNGVPITLIQPSAINFTVNTVNVTGCWYNTNGRITVSGVSGGTGSKTVSIDGINYFPTTKIFNVGVGTFTVYVKDANGCISTKPAVITGPPAIVVDAVTVTDASCFGKLDGSINASASGGTPPLEYSIDGINYQAAGLFNGVAGGTHTLYIRDANGCILEQPVTVGQPAALYFTTQSATDITCFGLTDGQITLVAAGGTGPYSYSITGGAPYGNATGIFTGLSAGGYTAAVMDANGCNIAGNPLTISEPPIIQITGTISTDITCFGASDGTILVTAIGGTPPRVYRLVDAGAVVVATNGDGNFTGVNFGTYTVEVSDANNCTPAVSVPIVISEPPVITISSVDVTDVSGCSGDNNGALTINATGGTGALTYSINGGPFQASNTFTNLTAGPYTVVVQDVNGCTQTDNATISEPGPLNITSLIVDQETVAGAGDGRIRITATGGTGDLTYDLYFNGVYSTSQTITLPAIPPADFTNLVAGTYYVLVTDANGCFVQTADILISGTSIVVTPTMVTCNGNNDGRILLTITGGFPPFTIGCTNSTSQPFTFNDLGGGQFELTGLSPETYTITIADTKTTYPDEVVTITEPTVLTANFVSLVNPTCNGLADGTVEFNITGGTAPYSIAWSGGTSVGNIATNVAAGSYTFTIEDANGCQVDVLGVPALVEPDAITITDFAKVDVSCNGQPNGSITVTATGGTGLLTYSIVGPVNLSNNDGIFANLPTGTYNLTITDVNLCSATVAENPITLTEPSAIIITGTTPGSPLKCANTPDGFVDIDVTGGQPAYTFLWSNGSTNEDLTSVVAGSYTVVVTDALNCSVSQSFNILGADMLDLSVQIDSADCWNLWLGTAPPPVVKDFGEIRIIGSTGGNGTINDFTYLWDHPDINPDTDRTLSDLSGGTYRVTVTDTEGCVYTFDYDVPVKRRYDYRAFGGQDTTVCFDNPVTLHGDVIGGAPDLTFTYDWFIVPNIDGDPIFTGQDYVVQTTGFNIYRLRVVDSDLACWNDTYVDVDVLPKIGLHVPMYISAVKDTIISVLYGQETNIDVNTESVAYETQFQWKPAEMFLPSNNWNSSLLLNDEIEGQIPSDRFVSIKDPKTGRTSEYILVDVIATTELGCTDSIRLYTKIIEDVSFGNIFSPNGDGKNDFWRVPKNYLFPDLEIEIFNRWGSLVWSAKGDKAAKGWDGRTNSGNELPIGTYYYVVKFNVKAQGSSWKPLTGSVTIVK